MIFVHKYKRSRSDIWYLRYRNAGKDVHVSTKTEDERKAERQRIILQDQLNSNWNGSSECDFNFSEVIDDYIFRYAQIYLQPNTWHDYLSMSKRLKKYFNKKKIKNIKQADVMEFVYFLKNTVGNSNRTVNKYVSLLSGIFKYSISKGYIQSNPVKGIKKLKVPQYSHAYAYFKESEIRKLLDACTDDFRTILMTTFYTGMRTGELIGLRWTSVDFVNNNIIVRHSYNDMPKSGKERVIPIHHELLPVLKSHFDNINNHSNMDVRNSIYVFPNTRTGEMRDNFKTAYKAAIRRAEIKDRKFHATRDTFATLMLKSGCSLAQLQALLGHSTPQMTQKYSHIASEYKHLQEAINRLKI